METAILKTYLACNQTPPDDNGMLAKIALCMEDLAEIPTAALDECFRRARKAKGTGFFPSTGEICNAWKEIKAELQRRKERQEDMRRLRALPEYYPPEIAIEVRKMVFECHTTAERLERLKLLHDKYPTAGFDKEIHEISGA